MATGLTPKQEKFVQGLFKGLSQRQAYKEAYDTSNWKDSSIDEKAYQLSKNVHIMSRLRELQETITQNNKWTVEKLIEEFEELKDRCKMNIPVLDRQGEPTGEYKFDSAGAVKSLENIGKLLGMYEEKIKHSGKIELPKVIISK
jgi:hypothetical protein